MKRFWKTAFLLLLIVNLFIVFSSGKTISHTYPMAAQVFWMDHENDVVIFVDGAGNCWEIYGTEDWQVGDIAGLLMDDAGTPDNIIDDTVVDARYGFSLLSVKGEFYERP